MSVCSYVVKYIFLTFFCRICENTVFGYQKGQKSKLVTFFESRQVRMKGWLRPWISTVNRNGVCRFVCMCRTIVIQSALDRGVSGASQKTFPDKFGPFLTSPGSFEVARLVKKRRNFDLNLSFIHVTF